MTLIIHDEEVCKCRFDIIELKRKPRVVSKRQLKNECVFITIYADEVIDENVKWVTIKK